MRPILKTRMLIYQSKAYLDEKILFGKINLHLDPEIRKMLANLGTRFPHSILIYDLLAIIKMKILF